MKDAAHRLLLSKRRLLQGAAAVLLLPRPTSGEEMPSCCGAQDHPLAQHPRLLDGYTARPPWQVAGVDYALGIHPDKVLKNPAISSLPAGASYDATYYAVYLTGRNVTLDGYDLTNTTVMIQDLASGTITISNCSAAKGVNIRSTVGAKANLVVKHCTLDGGGKEFNSNFQTIKVWTPLTVEYCVIKNSPAAIYAGASSVTVRYNLLEAFGWAPPDHTNVIYVTGSNDSSTSTLIAYNTIYSGASRDSSGLPIGLGAAIAFFDDGGNFYRTEVSNNTVISALPGGASYLIGYYVFGSHSATGGKVYDNYLSSVNGFNGRNSGAFGPFYTGSSGVVSAKYAGNVDLNTGRILSPP